ncbi:MAG: hypothetical protein ACOCZ5_00765 [bacterium]
MAMTSNQVFSQDYYTNEEESDIKVLFLRGGLSDMTGFVGIEYFVNSTSAAIGWHKFAPSITDESFSCIDISLYWYNGKDYTENGLYTGIGYSSTNAVQTYNGVVDETSGTLNFVGGYRWGGEHIDLKLGAGYLYSGIYDGVAIDLSLGVTF